MRDFRDLKVWQKSRDLAAEVYRATAAYPRAERFALTQQTHGSVISVAANIAEGCGRHGSKEFARFIDIALGSAYELASHLEVAMVLGYLPQTSGAHLLSLLDEIRRMMVGLVRTLAKR